MSKGEAMNQCPKCGSTYISGPTYSPGQGCRCHPEKLIYRCQQCGFVQRGSTRERDCERESKTQKLWPYRKYRWAVATLLLLFAPSMSNASTLPAPKLQPGHFVYTIPANWTPPGFSHEAIDEMDTVARSLKYPFYVVLVHDLPGSIGATYDQMASQAVDDIATDWASQNGYDVGKSQVFLLSFEPRKWRFLAGATWRQQFGFERDAHEPYTDHFVRAVKGTPKDPKGGIIATMRAVDGYLWSQTDPVQVAARLERSRQDAIVESQHEVVRLHRIWVFFQVLLIGGVLFGSLYLLVRRRRDYLRLKYKFITDDAKWTTLTTNAENQYTAVYTERDDVVGLDRCEGETKALYDRVTEEVNDIYLCIRGLESHVANCRHLASQAGFFRLNPLRCAIEKLNGQFEFDTERVNQDDLFGTATKVLLVTPSKFAAEQAERFKCCQEDWKLLKTAAETRLRRIEEQLPITHLHALRKSLKDAGLADHWVSDHPLHHPEKVYALNKIRTSDPLAAARLVSDIHVQQNAIEERVCKLLTARDEVSAARISNVPALETQLDQADDPAHTIGEAQNLEQRLAIEGGNVYVQVSASPHLNVTTTLFEYLDLSKKVCEIYSRAAQQISVALAAPNSVKIALESATDEQKRLDTQLECVNDVVKRAMLTHATKGVLPALDQLHNARDSATRGAMALAKAKALCKDQYLVSATREASAAWGHYELARREGDKAVATCHKLDSKKVEFETRTAKMEATRKQREKQLVDYGRSVKLRVWTAPVVNDLLDYDMLLAQQIAHEAVWQAEVATAERSWRAAETAREADAQAARRWNDSSSSSSSSSDYSSSSSGDWGGGDGGSSSSGGDW